MACKLDVDITVQNLVQREVKNIGKITNGVATVTQKFNTDNLNAIKAINDKVKEKMVSYVKNDVTDLPGTVNITISDKLYDKYMIAIDNFRNSNNANYKLSAVEILNTDKATQVFAKANKNGWDLNKILTELQIPKEQKQIILDKYKGKVSEQEFIKSIFPDTKVKQIVYHGSSRPERIYKNKSYSSYEELILDYPEFNQDYSNLPIKNKEKFNAVNHIFAGLNSAHLGTGIYFDKNIKEASVYDKGELIKAVVNVSNPYSENVNSRSNNRSGKSNQELIDKGFDANIEKTNIAIFDSKQIYIITEEEQAKIYNQDNLREEIITSLLAENSFTVEINTAKEKRSNSFLGNTEDGALDDSYYFEQEEDLEEKNTQYYSNLTVPGGTNYTENEIATPDIVPNIKGHGQFSTDNGIGWFRSDNKTTNNIKDTHFTNNFTFKDDTYVRKQVKIGGVIVFESFKNNNLISNEQFEEDLFNSKNSKTRRILELQSDLFQKGRDKKDLVNTDNIQELETKKKELEDKLEKETLNILKGTIKIDLDRVNTKISLLQNKENKFLQLLNKKGNWVNFFIQAIVQDSVKKGYKKVLFPTGETAAKVEGHQTIADDIKKLNAKIEEEKKKFTYDMYRPDGELSASGLTEQELNSDYDGIGKTKKQQLEEKGAIFKKVNRTKTLENLEKQKQEMKSQGIEKLKPIEAFYTNRVTNILNKLYKGRIQEVTDEFNNTWNEITTKLEDSNESFTLNLERQQAKKKEYKSFMFDKTKVSIAPANISEEEINKNKSDILNELFDGTFKPTTLNAFLRNLYSNSNIKINEEGLALMKALLPSRSKIKFVTSAVLTDEVIGRYDSLTRTILLNKDIIGNSNLYYVIESILHEGTHDITAVALNQPKTDKQIAFRNNIQKAFDYYTKAAEYANLKGDNYGFTNINEFTSEIMTNSSFRNKLKAVESNESVWKQFINAIKEFLGLNNKNYDSIKVQEIVNSIIDIASEEYSNNNQSSLNMTFEKRTRDSIKSKKEIEDNLEKELTNVKNLITRIYATIEDVKVKSNDAKGGKYKDKYKKIQDNLKDLQSKSEEKAILEYLNFSVDELYILKNSIQNKENPSLDYLSRFKSYMVIFSNNDSIRDIAFSLKKYNKITEEEYKKLTKNLDYVESQYNTVYKSLIDKMKDALIEPLAAKNDRVTTEYYEIFEREYNKNKPTGYTKDEYITEQMNENIDSIQAEKRAKIRKSLDLINIDISGFDTYASSEKLTDSTFISILSEKIDEADFKVRQVSMTQRNKIAVKERKANFQGNSNEKRYAFMLDKTKDNQYFVTQYKSEFNDIVEDFERKLNNLEYGSKEHIQIKNERNKWIKENYKNNKPINKWINPKYTALSGFKKDYYDFYIQQLKENNEKTNGINSLFRQPFEDGPVFIRLNGITQSTSDKILSGKAVNAVKTGIKDIFKDRKDEDSYGNLINEETDDQMYERTRTDLNNQAVNSLPVYYRNKINVKDQSYDLSTMLAMDTMMAENYKQKKEIEAEADVLLTVIGESSVLRRNIDAKALVAFFKKTGEISKSDLVREQGKNSNIYKKLKSMMDNRIYGITDVYQGKILGISINQLSNSTASATADLQLGLNALTALPNVLQAKFQNFIEGIGGDIFTVRDIAKAEKIYAADMANILNDIGSTTNSSKINVLIETFDLMGNFSIIKNAFESRSKLRSVANKNSIHAMNGMGEHYAQATLMIAVMNSIKVKNKKGQFIDFNGNVTTKKKAMTLYEAYEKKVDKDGIVTLELNKNAESTSHSAESIKGTGQIHHQQLIRKLTIKLHGQYDSKWQSHIERYWWGKLILMFRKWMVSAYKRRYAGALHSLKKQEDLTDEQRIYDYEMKRFDEGIYTSFVRYIRHGVMPAIANFKLELATQNWKEMTDMEKSNIRKTITELMITGMMATAAMLTYAAADDDDDEILFTLAYIFRRQQSEFMQFYHPSENMRVFRSPAVALNTLEKTYSFFTQIMPWSIGEDYEGGRNRGENRAWIKFKKLIPVIAQFERSPQELFNFLENSAK